MKSSTVGILVLVFAGLPSLAAAQPPESQRDRARTFLVVRIADALKLGDQDALKVSTAIRQADERRQQLVQQREALEERLRAALGKTPADPADLATLIAAGNELDQKLALVPEDTFRELQKTLTVEQQAKLMLFRRELQGEVRRAMQRRAGSGRRTQQGRSGSGGPPHADE